PYQPHGQSNAEHTHLLAGGHRRDLARGRRHWRDEHHARLRHRTDTRNRHPHDHWRARLRRVVSVPDRGRDGLLYRRPGRRPSRYWRWFIHLRDCRLARDFYACPDPHCLRVRFSDGHRIWLSSRQKGRPTRPHRGPGPRLGWRRLQPVNPSEARTHPASAFSALSAHRPGTRPSCSFRPARFSLRLSQRLGVSAVNGCLPWSRLVPKLHSWQWRQRVLSCAREAILLEEMKPWVRWDGD